MIDVESDALEIAVYRKQNGGQIYGFSVDVQLHGLAIEAFIAHLESQCSNHSTDKSCSDTGI